MSTRSVGTLWLALAFASPLRALATQYDVSIDTANLKGLPGAIVFEFTSGDPFLNSVTLLNFTHDGTTGLPETQGGLVEGDIILLLNPAPFTTIGDTFFFNELKLPFASFGSSITFTFQMTENPATGLDTLPPEFSLYLLGSDRRALPTADPLGADAFFAICIDGTTTGFLSVFDPTIFTPPDQLTILAPEDLSLVFLDGFESGNASAWSSTNP